MNSARKKLIVHVGAGKTGTTAMQHFLWRNRELLLEHGIAYPNSGIRDAAHHLMCPDPPAYLESRTGWDFMSPPEVLASLEACDSPTIVLSSELFFSSSPRKLKQLIKQLREVFVVQAVAYLRPQREAIYSRYNQRVKSGLEKRPFLETLPGMVGNLDYSNKLGPLRDVLGLENLILRPYEFALLERGDIREDFFWHVLGRPIPDDFDMPPETFNPKFPDSLLEYKRLLNNVISDREEHKLSNRLLLEFAGEVLAGRQDKKSLPAIPRKYLKKLDMANRKLAREYNGTGEYFFSDSQIGKSGLKPKFGRRYPIEKEVSVYLAGKNGDFIEVLQRRIAEALSNGDRNQRSAARKLRRSFRRPWYAFPGSDKASE